VLAYISHQQTSPSFGRYGRVFLMLMVSMPVSLLSLTLKWFCLNAFISPNLWI